MDEQQLLSRLRRGDEQALAAVIARFSAYVVTVIHNRSRGLLPPEDEDELASSTFFALLEFLRIFLKIECEKTGAFERI